MNNDHIVKEAMLYCSYGWHVVPLWGITEDGKCSCGKGNCGGSSGKHPIHPNWKNHCMRSEDDVLASFDRYPCQNIGVLLGPKSGIIDIEFDTEEGAKTAEELLSGCITPTYKSGKSVHRLFQFDSDLSPDKGRIDWRGLEIRVGGEGNSIQSVFPPSMHHSGVNYRWERGLDPEHCDVLRLPLAIVAEFVNNPEGVRSYENTTKASEYIKEDITQGARNDKLFKWACSLAGSYGTKCDQPANYDAIMTSVQSINEVRCKPPMTVKEVQTLVNSAISMELRSQQAVIGNNAERETNKSVVAWGLGWDRATGEFFPNEWSLVVENCDPPRYHIIVPAWAGKTNDGKGTITVEADAYYSPDKMARAILGATMSIVVDEKPGQWRSIWNGGTVKINGTTHSHKGLKAKLAEAATFIEGAPVDRKCVVISEYVLASITRATKPKDGKDDPKANSPHGSLRNDGSIWFSWSTFFDEGILSKKFTTRDLARWRNEVLELKPQQGLKRWPISSKEGHRNQYFVLNHALKQMITQYLEEVSRITKQELGRATAKTPNETLPTAEAC